MFGLFLGLARFWVWQGFGSGKVLGLARFWVWQGFGSGKVLGLARFWVWQGSGSGMFSFVLVWGHSCFALFLSWDDTSVLGIPSGVCWDATEVLVIPSFFFLARGLSYFLFLVWGFLVFSVLELG